MMDRIESERLARQRSEALRALQTMGVVSDFAYAKAFKDAGHVIRRLERIAGPFDDTARLFNPVEDFYPKDVA